MPDSEFKRTEDKAKALRDKLLVQTFGKVLSFVEKHDVIDSNELETLKDILTKRNDLVHQYFKRKDFEKHSSISKFLTVEGNYLRKFLRKATSFNDRLCSLIEEQEAEYEMIEDS